MGDLVKVSDGVTKGGGVSIKVSEWGIRGGEGGGDSVKVSYRGPKGEGCQ